MANPPPKIRWAIFITVALLAFALRLPQLGGRPMHTDESVNAYIIGQLLAGEKYQYDPQDRHGPALAEITLPLVRLQGASTFASLTESELRLAPVIGGSLAILLFGAGVELFGFIPCFFAAWLFAFAPLPIYYSRYFIHETFFVAATFGLLLSLLKPRQWGTAIGIGFCAAFMVACKETAMLHFVALGIAMFASRILNPSPASAVEMSPRKFWLTAFAIFSVAGILLFTWFGRDWAALSELFHAAPRLLARAGGEGHQKPFWYYFSLLHRTPCLLELSAVGLILTVYQFVQRREIFRGWMMLYGILITFIYCAIPYKTPWLALNLFLPLSLLAGFAVAGLWNQSKVNLAGRLLFVFGWIILTVFLLRDVKRQIFIDPGDENNPYAYAHTVDDLLGLPERVAELSASRPASGPRIAVVAADPWPLPWYLRKFPQTGFWQPGQDPGPADFYVTTTDWPTNLQSRFKSYQPEYFGVRPNVLLILWTPTRSFP